VKNKMQRRAVPRTDPRYDQIRSRNNDSVKKSREKSRRERDDTMGSIHQLEEENEQLIERIQLLKREYEQLQELFKQHTGISLDQLESSNITSIPPKPVEQLKEGSSEPVLTININDEKIAAVSDIELDPSTLDGAIVLINGVQYKIVSMDKS
jgi:predicted nuclease with TOPRIM domain